MKVHMYLRNLILTWDVRFSKWLFPAIGQNIYPWRLYPQCWTLVQNALLEMLMLQLSGILNTGDSLHMYVLHYVFLPRINVSVESFVRGWNAHPMRTLRNWSPERTFVNGLMDVRNRFQTQICDWYRSPPEQAIDMNWYGVDFNGPLPTDDDLPNVEVSDLDSPLTGRQDAILRSINPLRDSTVFGMDVFIDALHSVNSAN